MEAVRRGGLRSVSEFESSGGVGEDEPSIERERPLARMDDQVRKAEPVRLGNERCHQLEAHPGVTPLRNYVHTLDASR